MTVDGNGTVLFNSDTNVATAEDLFVSWNSALQLIDAFFNLKSVIDFGGPSIHEVVTILYSTPALLDTKHCPLQDNADQNNSGGYCKM